jgi:hypothetical protein
MAEETMRTDKALVGLTSVQTGNGYAVFAALSDGRVYCLTDNTQQWAAMPAIPGTLAELHETAR